MKKLITFLFGLFSTSLAFSALQTPIDCNFAFNGTNFQVIWNAYPGKSYVIQTSTNLAGVWSNAATLTTTSSSITSSFPMTVKTKFFKIVKLDTDGPEIYQTTPLDGGIAVSRQSTLQSWLRDDNGINTNSITFTVGTNLPVTMLFE